MRKKKLAKNTFYCEKDGLPCTIYKKGKNHRVLVCPKCGVLATNGLLKSALDIATDFVPGGKVVKLAASALGINPLDEKEKAAPRATSSTSRYSEREKIHDALRL